MRSLLPRCCIPLLLLALTGAATARTPYRTLVVFGDTQHLVEAGPGDPGGSFERFLAMTRWVAENARRENVDFVLHVGDIIQHGSLCALACSEAEARIVNAEWDRFREGWSAIEAAGIPFAIVPGNHDNVYPLRLPDAERTTPVDAYASFFGREAFEGTPSHVATCDAETPDPRCAGPRTLGHVWRFDLGGREVLVAGLPDQPQDEVTSWFEDALRAWPGTPAILLSHQWLRPFDLLWFRYLTPGRGGPPVGPLSEQVFMTAMGHFSADLQAIVPASGYRVLSVRFDRQGVVGDGDAALLLVRFYLDPRGSDAVDALRLEPGPLLVRGSFPGRTAFAIDHDIDHDAVLDADDNCPEAWNPDQRDADADGRGNRCDADLDDDGEITRQDLRRLIACLPHGALARRARPSPPGPGLAPAAGCDAADLDGSGRIDGRDLALFLEAWRQSRLSAAARPARRPEKVASASESPLL